MSWFLFSKIMINIMNYPALKDLQQCQNNVQS